MLSSQCRTMLGGAMKYFFAVLVSAVLLVSGCEEAPPPPPPKPAATVATTPATMLPSPKPIVTHHILVIGDSLTQGSPESTVTWPALVWPTLAARVGIVDPVIAGEGASGYVHPGNAGSTFGERATMYVNPKDELVVFFGLPGALPDIASLAWRIPPTPDLRSCTPWDVLLASTVANSRVVLAPMRSWSSSTFSSLTPFRFRGGVWWVRARLITKIDEPGLSLDPIRNQIDSGELDFDIEQALGTGRFEPLARLTLRHLDPSRDDIAFDPALHCDEDVELVPGWLRGFRRDQGQDE